MRRLATLTIAAACAGILVTAGMTGPADAAQCTFRAFSPLQGKFHSSIEGHAFAVKKKNACKRAERRCIRKLRRAWDKGRAQSFGCRELGQAG